MFLNLNFMLCVCLQYFCPLGLARMPLFEASAAAGTGWWVKCKTKRGEGWDERGISIAGLKGWDIDPGKSEAGGKTRCCRTLVWTLPLFLVSLKCSHTSERFILFSLWCERFCCSRMPDIYKYMYKYLKIRVIMAYGSWAFINTYILNLYFQLILLSLCYSAGFSVIGCWALCADTSTRMENTLQRTQVDYSLI